MTELILTGVPCVAAPKEDLELDGAGERVPRPCDKCNQPMWVGPRGLKRWDEIKRHECMYCLMASGELVDSSQLRVMSKGEA